jgi:hypothetical protein
MSACVIEIVGELNVYYPTEYLDELKSVDDLREPILVTLRNQIDSILHRELQSKDDYKSQQRNVQAARTVIDSALHELLKSHEGSIAESVRRRIEDQHWRRRHDEMARRDHEPEPELDVAVHFGRGSIIYTIAITILEATGPMLAKGALLSLATAAVEPAILRAAASVCHASKNMTSNVKRVVIRSGAKRLVGPAVERTDNAIDAYSDHLAQIAGALNRSRYRRVFIGLAMLLLGLVMTNIAMLIAIWRKIGLA